MALPADRLLSYAAYLELERATGTKHEFLDGVAYAMTGGTVAHAVVSANALVALAGALGPRGCRTHSADQRLRIPASGRAFYADAAVTCGAIVTHPEDPDAITAPVVLVEVLSPTTERHDLGLKLAEYRTLPSLRAILFVRPERREVVRWRRDAEGEWAMTVHGPSDAVPLTDGATVAVDAFYLGLAPA